MTFIPEQIEPTVYKVDYFPALFHKCLLSFILQCIETVLKDKVYNDLHVQSWIDEICTRITRELVEMNKPFKYIGVL